MARVIVLALAFSVASTTAFAHRCPEGIATIDAALRAPDFPDYERPRFTEYRQQAENLHRAGRHEEALDVLGNALETLYHLH